MPWGEQNSLSWVGCSGILIPAKGSLPCPALILYPSIHPSIRPSIHSHKHANRHPHTPPSWPHQGWLSPGLVVTLCPQPRHMEWHHEGGSEDAEAGDHVP